MLHFLQFQYYNTHVLKDSKEGKPQGQGELPVAEWEVKLLDRGMVYQHSWTLASN